MDGELQSCADFASQASPFLRLPAELRNHIYRAAIVPEQQLRIWSYSIKLYSPILKVCRQTRFEASSIFFEENTFTVSLGNGNTDTLSSWLRVIGKHNIKRIKCLSIKYLMDNVDSAIVREARKRQESGSSGLAQGSVLDGIYQRQHHIARTLISQLLEAEIAASAITAPDVRIMAMGGRDARFFGQLVDLHWKWVIDVVKREHGDAVVEGIIASI